MQTNSEHLFHSQPLSSSSKTDIPIGKFCALILQKQSQLVTYISSHQQLTSRLFQELEQTFELIDHALLISPITQKSISDMHNVTLELTLETIKVITCALEQLKKTQEEKHEEKQKETQKKKSQETTKNLCQLIKTATQGSLEILTSYIMVSEDNNLSGQLIKEQWVIFGSIVYLFSIIYNPYNTSLCITTKNIKKLSLKASRIIIQLQNLHRIICPLYSNKQVRSAIATQFYAYKQCCSSNDEPLFTFFGKALRNYVKRPQLLKNDCLFIGNRLNTSSQTINNCQLLINCVSEMIILFDDINPRITQKQLGLHISKIKMILQWLTLLINICEGKALTPNQNSHIYFNYVIDFCLYLSQFEINPNPQQQQNQTINNLIQIMVIYMSQILSLALFRNPHSVVTHCRNKECLKEIVEIWKNGYKLIEKKSNLQCDEFMIEKRMILGLFGLILLDSHETVIEETVIEMFPVVIKAIEKINGVQQEQEGVEVQQNNKGLKIEDFWDEYIENKNTLQFIEQTDQIQELKISLRHLSERNPQLFQQLMKNFNAHQIILWTLELESKQDQ